MYVDFELDEIPPPSFDRRTDVYSKWKRRLEVWLYATDGDIRQQAPNIIFHLDEDTRKELLQSITKAQYSSEEGVNIVLNKLTEMFEPELQTVSENGSELSLHENPHPSPENLFTHSEAILEPKEKCNYPIKTCEVAVSHTSDEDIFPTNLSHNVKTETENLYNKSTGVDKNLYKYHSNNPKYCQMRGTIRAKKKHRVLKAKYKFLKNSGEQVLTHSKRKQRKKNNTEFNLNEVRNNKHGYKKLDKNSDEADFSEYRNNINAQNSSNICTIDEFAIKEDRYSEISPSLYNYLKHSENHSEQDKTLQRSSEIPAYKYPVNDTGYDFSVKGVGKFSSDRHLSTDLVTFKKSSFSMQSTVKNDIMQTLGQSNSNECNASHMMNSKANAESKQKENILTSKAILVSQDCSPNLVYGNNKLKEETSDNNHIFNSTKKKKSPVNVKEKNSSCKLSSDLKSHDLLNTDESKVNFLGDLHSSLRPTEVKITELNKTTKYPIKFEASKLMKMVQKYYTLIDNSKISLLRRVSNQRMVVWQRRRNKTANHLQKNCECFQYVEFITKQRKCEFGALDDQEFGSGLVKINKVKQQKKVLKKEVSLIRKF